jgi:hypothetical protein
MFPPYLETFNPLGVTHSSTLESTKSIISAIAVTAYCTTDY